MKAVLVGDLSPTVINNELFREKNVEALFYDAASVFENSDVNFVNLECALTESEKSIEKFGPPLKACAETAETLKLAGVNYCGLSNNHIFDYGIQGVRDTFAALDAAGIGYTGFGENYEDSRKNLVIEKNGEKAAIIAVCEHEYSYALEDRMGSRPYDEYDTMFDIREAKAECDRVIVIYHGGKEYCQYPSPRLHKLCRAMVKHGADVVICQHSHCIGCYEKFMDGHIFYGQGNFHFVEPRDWNDPTYYETLAVRYDTKENSIEFIPMVAQDCGIALAKGAEKERLLTEFSTRNEKLADGRWREEWHQFCLARKDQYYGTVGRACTEESTERNNKIFGHYLDCEAHTDVWRELFRTANMTNEKE